MLLLAAYLVWRRRQGGAGVDLTSGTPGGWQGSSGAQQPSGGAASVPGNLPPSSIAEPDPVQTAVQTTDASSAEAPTASATPTATPSAPSNPYWPTNPYINPYATPYSGPGNTNPGTTDPQPAEPGQNITGHGFVDPN